MQLHRFSMATLAMTSHLCWRSLLFLTLVRLVSPVHHLQ